MCRDRVRHFEERAELIPFGAKFGLKCGDFRRDSRLPRGELKELEVLRQIRMRLAAAEVDHAESLPCGTERNVVNRPYPKFAPRRAASSGNALQLPRGRAQAVALCLPHRTAWCLVGAPLR